MTPFAKERATRRWARVAAFAVLAITGLAAFAIQQGHSPQPVSGAVIALGAIGGAGVGRLTRSR